MYSTKKHVLIVEDVPRLVNQLTSLLDDRFICTVVNSVEGLHKFFATGTTNIILLDLSLPNGKGLQVLQDVADQIKEIPIIVVADDSDKNTAIEAINFGAQDYLIKNCFSGLELFKAMDSALRRSLFMSRLDVLVATAAETQTAGDRILARYITQLRKSAGQKHAIA